MRQILHTDGRVTELPAPVSRTQIKELLGATSLDIVSYVVDGQHVMFVDDLGHQKLLPVNAAGTDLYHARCIPGSDPPPIVGDVVVAPIGDF